MVTGSTPLLPKELNQLAQLYPANSPRQAPGSLHRRVVLLDIQTGITDKSTPNTIDHLAMIPLTYDGSTSTITHVNAWEYTEYVAVPQERRSYPTRFDAMFTNPLTQHFDSPRWNEYASTYLKNVDYIVAHNAAFDYKLATSYWPAYKQVLWLCSWRDIPWANLGFATSNLHALATHYEIPHRKNHQDALADCSVLARLLDQQVALPVGSPIKAHYWRPVLWYLEQEYRVHMDHLYK